MLYITSIVTLGLKFGKSRVSSDPLASVILHSEIGDVLLSGRCSLEYAVAVVFSSSFSMYLSIPSDPPSETGKLDYLLEDDPSASGGRRQSTSSVDSRTTNGDRDSLLALARESSSGSGAAGAEEDDSMPLKIPGRKVGFSLRACWLLLFGLADHGVLFGASGVFW